MTQPIHIQATGTEEQFEQLLVAFSIDEDAIEGSEKGFDTEVVRYWLHIPYQGDKETTLDQIDTFIDVEEVLN